MLRSASEFMFGLLWGVIVGIIGMVLVSDGIQAQPAVRIDRFPGDVEVAGTLDVSTSVDAPVFGLSGTPVTILTSKNPPAAPTDSMWWVECTGVSPNRTC